MLIHNGQNGNTSSNISRAFCSIARHHRKIRRVILVAIAALTFSSLGVGAPIPVQNGNFMDTSNNGSVGGGLIGSSGSADIGGGPWQGTYAGILDLLAPPLLTINSGHATISGLAGTNVLVLVNNGGYFSQNLSTAYTSNQHYVLSAIVDAASALDTGTLNNGNVGLALTEGTTILASTADAPASAVSLSLLNGTSYQLSLSYDTGTIVSGNIGIELLAEPQNLVSANLLGTVNFSNVTLSGGEINPVATALAPIGGTPQGAIIETAFSSPFVVDVIDANGDPVANVAVTFSVPTSGPSAILSAITATTDVNGHAQVTGSANATAGSYTMTATVSGIATPASFDLTNIAGAVHSIVSSLGTPQNAMVNTTFTTPLGVTVNDAGNNPIGGITVTFSAPGSGASATFASGVAANTDASGYAQIDAIANSVAGNYIITASVAGATATASFALTNTAGPASLVLPSSGTPQSAVVTLPFALPLTVEVTDSYNNPKSGITVSFSAPSTGASATLSPGTSVVTGSNGLAQVNGTANGIVGSYQVTAGGSGLATQAVFNLTNTATQTASGESTSGNGQSAAVNTEFACLLQVIVTSEGTTPMPGVSLDFVAATSGPSATLSDGTNTGSTVTEITDANGLATVSATANADAGSHTVSVGITGSGSALATYQLTNLAANDQIFANGFETMPSLCAQRN